MRVSEEHVTHPDAAFRFLALELPAFGGPRPAVKVPGFDGTQPAGDAAKPDKTRERARDR